MKNVRRSIIDINQAKYHWHRNYNYEIVIIRATYIFQLWDSSFDSTEQIHADTNDDLHDGHVGRTQCRVRLHLWHTGVSTYSRIRGPGYIIVLRAQRGAQPTCNANTQRGALSSEPLVGISPLQEYDWKAVSQIVGQPACAPVFRGEKPIVRCGESYTRNLRDLWEVLWHAITFHDRT